MSREDYLKNIPLAPDWIANPPPQIKKGSTKRGNLEVALTHPVDESTSRARAVLDKLSDELAREAAGGRNDTLNKAAYTMGGHITTGAITRDEVEASLTMACHRNGLVADDGIAAVEKTIASGIGKGMERPIYPEDAIAADEYDSIEPSALPPKSESSLSDLTRPPGLVGDIVDWIEASSEFPSRELALGAALGWVATLAGRGFETPSRARTNLYMVALAPSGYGKDHAGSCIGTLAMASGLDRFIGPARFMSASALRETLISHPSILCIQDEFGGILRQIDGPRVGIHNEMIRFDMLGLFSRAKDFYQGVAYAEKKAIKLFNPNLSIYGMSTPSEFWGAVTSARNADGFLPRFILFNIDAPKPSRVKPQASSGEPPAHLTQASQALYSATYGGGNLVGALSTGEHPQAARKVDLTDRANAALDEFERRIETALALGEAKREPFLNRAREHALKLALTVAVGVNPSSPLIDEFIMEWGINLAWVSTCAMIGEAESKIADNERQEIYNRILGFVRKEGEAGISPGRLRDRLSGTIRKSDWNEIVDELIQTGRIRKRTNSTTGRGRPSERYFAREFFSAANDNQKNSPQVPQAQKP